MAEGSARELRTDARRPAKKLIDFLADIPHNCEYLFANGGTNPATHLVFYDDELDREKREWLATINYLLPRAAQVSVSETIKRLGFKL